MRVAMLGILLLLGLAGLCLLLFGRDWAVVVLCLVVASGVWLVATRESERPVTRVGSPLPPITPTPVPSPVLSCPACSGRGVRWLALANGSGAVQRPCPECHGYGRLPPA